MQIVDEFCEYVLMNSAISEITVDGYRKYLNKILKDLGRIHPEEIDFKRYFLKMRKKYSVSYINNMSTAIEKYMKWVGKPIKLPRLKRHRDIIYTTLTPAEIARIIAAADNSREKAIIGILAYSGIRNRELCNLLVKDVDFFSATLTIRNGKGGIDRRAFITKEGLSLIHTYLNEYPRDEEDFLFTVLGTKKQYNPSYVRKLVGKLTRKARIEKRVYPHLFRHSLACNLLERGANIMTIQHVLGHKHLSSTIIYAHSTPQRVNMEYNYYIPSYL